MKKRHVLILVVLAFLAFHLAVYLMTGCADKILVSERRSVSYHKTGIWNKSHLTWSLITPPPIPNKLSEKDLLRAIDRSFKAWEHAGIFTFSRASGKAADITISFEKPPDQNWDGRMGTMGAAFYPWLAGRGQIYLDPSEWWSAKPFALLGDPITDWLPHEIGHALGLPHVIEPGYVMNESGPFGLPDKTDLSLLQKLYSPRTLVPTWTKNTPISAETLSRE